MYGRFSWSPLTTFGITPEAPKLYHLHAEIERGFDGGWRTRAQCAVLRPRMTGLGHSRHSRHPGMSGSPQERALSGGDEHIGELLRPVHHHVVAAGDADELPAPIILEASAELLERRRLPSGGKHVRVLPHLPATEYELLLKCRQWLLDAHRVYPGSIFSVDGKRSCRNGRNLVPFAVLRGVGSHPCGLLGG